MAPSPDILILGGGVIGLTTAYFLARDGGAKVEILEQGDFGQEASWAGAGILPPGNPARARSPYDQLSALGAQLHPGLAAELRERTGIDNGYRRCGGLEFFSEEDAFVEAAWREEGIAFEKLDETATRRLEPGLAVGLGGAFFLPELAQVRNPRHLKALLAACTATGVRMRHGCPVQGFDRKAGRIVGIRTADGVHHADRCLIATGAWTGPLLEPFGLRPGIKPIRGQIVLLNSAALTFRRVLMAGLRYLVPRGDGRVLVGSTEEDAGFDKRNTAEAVKGLLEFATSRVPSLAKANIEHSWAGLRPGSPDGMPFLGRVPEVENLYVAAGHFRAGIQLSPATAVVMKELMLAQKPSVPLEAFRLDRSPAPRQRVAFRS
jgi:glycine oxidase